MSDGRANRACIGLLLGLVLVFFLPVFMKGTSAVVGAQRTDGLTMFYPLRYFADHELLSGRMPLWNPYIFCGQPAHAEAQAAIFYPPNLLLAPLPAALSLNVFAFAHFVAMGLFFYLYLREIQLGPAASLLGSLAFQFSTVPMARLYGGHYTNLPYLVAVPLFLWVWERWTRRAMLRWLFLAAAVYGCMILAGHPQFLLYSTFYFSWHVVFGALRSLKERRHQRALILLGGFAGLILAGVLAGAVQLLPTYNLVGYSLRQKLTFEFCATFSFAPENFLTLLAPGFFGDIHHFPYWGRNFLWEMWIYIGIVPLAMAIVAAARVRSRHALVHGLAIPIFILLALGHYTPLLRFLYDYVPFFNMFRGNCKFIAYSCVSLCALAGMGAERLFNPPDEAQGRGDRRWLLAALGVMAALAAGLLLVFSQGAALDNSAWERLIQWRFEQGETWAAEFAANRLPPAAPSWKCASAYLWKSLVFALAGVAAVLAWGGSRRRQGWFKAILPALALCDLWLFSYPYLETASIAGESIPDKLVSIIHADKEPSRVLPLVQYPNACIYADLETPLGYAGLITARYNHFLTAVNKLTRRQSMVTPPPPSAMQLGLLWPNTNYIIADDATQFPEGWVAEPPLARSEGCALYATQEKRPRAYFSSHAARFSSEDLALEAVESVPEAILKTDIIEAKTTEPLSGIQPPGQDDQIEFLERLPSRVSLQTRAAGRRLLVLADAFDPNWRCRMDGATDMAIYPVNIAFRGVVVPAGAHTLEFIYSPASFYWGVVVSAVAFIAWLAAFLRLAGVRIAALSGEDETGMPLAGKVPSSRPPRSRNEPPSPSRQSGRKREARRKGLGKTPDKRWP